jgi:hypothetical protein
MLKKYRLIQVKNNQFRIQRCCAYVFWFTIEETYGIDKQEALRKLLVYKQQEEDSGVIGYY